MINYLQNKRFSSIGDMISYLRIRLNIDEFVTKGKQADDGSYVEQIENMNAFENIMLRAEKRLPPSKKAFNGIVGREPVPVKSKIKSITTKIKRKGKVKFEELFDDAESRSEIVAIFLAVLELLRNREIGIKTTNEEIILGEIDGNL